MSVEAALQAAFEGPERKKLKIHGHEFNIKPIEIVHDGASTRAHGQISHHLAHRPDDQVYFDITLTNRVVTGVNRQVDKGGFAQIWSIIAPFLAAATGHKELNSSEIKEMIENSERLLNGTWLGVVDYLLGLFGTKLAAGYSLGQMSQALSGSPPEPASNTWPGRSSWQGLGAPSAGFEGAAAVVSRNPTVCNAYVRGGDGTLWQRAFYDGAWHDWERLDGHLTSTPAASSMGPGHEHVFVRGTDGQLWQKWWTAEEGWSSWQGLGAPSAGFEGAAAVVSRNPTVCNAYVRGGDGTLWQRAFYDGAWHDWERLDGHLTSTPAASSMGPGHEHVFVRGTDGQLWQKWWTAEEGWSSWQGLGAPSAGFEGAAAVVSRNPTVCNAYVRGGDGTLWQRAFYDGAWHDWERLDGHLTSTPAASSMGPGHEHVFVRGTDGQLWQKWWTA